MVESSIDSLHDLQDINFCTRGVLASVDVKDNIVNLDGKIEAKCVECGQMKKGTITSTGNFKSHYKMHPLKSKMLAKYLKGTDDDIIDVSKLTTSTMRDFLSAISESKVSVILNKCILL